MGKARTRTWLGVAIAVSAVGCMQGELSSDVTPTYGGGGSTDPYVSPQGSEAVEEIAVREARLAGPIGGVIAPDDEEPLVRAYRDGTNGVGTVELHRQGEGGAAMYAVYVFPSIDAIDVPVGTRVLVDENAFAEYSILTVGCAGQVDGAWDYDEQPQRTVMGVSDFDQDGDVELGFEATFGAEQTASGSEETVLARFEVASE